MGETTGIAWCDHTHNEWLGCMKVSAGCDFCYAEDMMDKRYHRVEWGQRKTETTNPSVGTRVLTSEANRKLPLRWARKARELPNRPRVFCSSLSDVFDNQVPPQWRAALWETIGGTPELDWLLLTKRPENIEDMLPLSWWRTSQCSAPWPNVWLGTTCEDQAAFDKRWPILQRVPARVRFISYEPAIGPLTMAGHAVKPSWLICGGESGQGHRAMQPQWAYRIMDECKAAGMPFFMKQMSGTRPASIPIPQDLMVRQFPMTGNEDGQHEA